MGSNTQYFDLNKKNRTKHTKIRYFICDIDHKNQHECNIRRIVTGKIKKLHVVKVCADHTKNVIGQTLVVHTPIKNSTICFMFCSLWFLMMFSRQIKQFIVLVQKNSFTKAADEISVTPSALSHGIRDLETRLGKNLIIRSKVGITLTPDGHFLYNEVAPLYKHCEHIFNTLVHRGCCNSLTIKTDGIYYPVISNSILSILKEFKMEISVTKGPPDTLMDDLENEKCDMVIRSDINMLAKKTKNTYLLFLPTDFIGLIVRDDIYRKYSSIKEIIENEKLIQYGEALTHPGFKTIDSEMKKNNFNYSVTGLPDKKDVHQAIINGLGISLIPESLTHSSEFGVEGLHFIRKPFQLEMKIHQGIYFKKEKYSDLIDIASRLQGTLPHR